MATESTIGRYLIEQLHHHGVRHVFGVPGDYALSLIDEVLHSPLTFVNTADEQGAGFAADAYARLNGLSALCVTYAVGSLKVANATAQGYAERSPMVVICGAPGLRERSRHPLLHHLVNQFDTQMQIFRQITVDAVALNDPESAYAQIDHALHAAIRHKRPVYLEIPRDLITAPGLPGHHHRDEPEPLNEAALSEALQEATAMLTSARQPVIIAGMELKRFGMHDALTRFAESLRIPVAVTMQGKSAITENYPRYLGVYAGAIGEEERARYVESSDCQLLLGTQLTDINLGMFTANLDQACMIVANADGVQIRNHTYPVSMQSFIDGLLGCAIPAKAVTALPRQTMPQPFHPEHGRTVTIKRVFQQLASFITEQTVVLAEVGDALFGALDLPISRAGSFLCTAYYSNMGFAVPGSIGVQCFNPTLRPLVLVGDGAFQMTGMELSTAAHYGLAPIVVVLNNQGYATERFFLDGPFNEVHPWDFSRVPEVLGTGKGFAVYTEDELEHALRTAEAHVENFSILDVHIARGDVSECLSRLGAYFSKTAHG